MERRTPAAGLDIGGEFRNVVGEAHDSEGAFDFAANEFDARRLQGFRAGLQAAILEQDEDDPQGDEIARLERIADFADMIGQGLTGAAFDAQMVTLPNGRRARMGDVRRALDFISMDFDRYVEEAQAAGILPRDMSQADKDRLRGEISDASATISAAEQSGSGVPREVIEGMSPDTAALVGFVIEDVGPRASVQRDVAPDPAPSDTSSFAPGL